MAGASVQQLSQCVPPDHPLFRQVLHFAFDEFETRALELLMGKDIRTVQLQRVLNAAMRIGWVGTVDKIVELAKMSRLALDLNSALVTAAENGHLEAMREAKNCGATNLNWALSSSAYRGHVDAMRLLKAWGATNIDWALGNAACGGRVEAMREARRWGATNVDGALNGAAREGQIGAMHEARAMGARNFGLAKRFAEKAGQVGAFTMLKAWQLEITPKHIPLPNHI